MSVLVCFLWGYLLYTGNIDRLWRMMGIANQLLATIALAVGTTYLLDARPKRIYALCTGVPLVFVVVDRVHRRDREHRQLVGRAGLASDGRSRETDLRCELDLCRLMLLCSAVIVVGAAGDGDLLERRSGDSVAKMLGCPAATAIAGGPASDGRHRGEDELTTGATALSELAASRERFANLSPAPSVRSQERRPS